MEVFGSCRPLQSSNPQQWLGFFIACKHDRWREKIPKLLGLKGLSSSNGDLSTRVAADSSNLLQFLGTSKQLALCRTTLVPHRPQTLNLERWSIHFRPPRVFLASSIARRSVGLMLCPGFRYRYLPLPKAVSSRCYSFEQPGHPERCGSNIWGSSTAK